MNLKCFQRTTVVLSMVFLFVFSGCSIKSNEPKKTVEANGQLNPEQMKKDLDYLIETILSSHPNPYAYISKEEFEAEKNKVYQYIRQPLTIDEFYVKCQYLVARLKNGHTSLWIPPSWPSRLNRGVFPILLKVVDEKVYLYGYFGDEKLPVGAEIININGESAISVAKELAAYFPREGRAENFGRLVNPLYVYYVLAMKFKDTRQISLEIKNDTNVYQIPAIPVNKANKKIMEFEAQNGQKRYCGLLNFDYLESYNTGLITVVAFCDRTNFEKLAREHFEKMKSLNVKNLIIDLRNCPGGNSAIADILIDYIASKPWRQFEKCTIKNSRLFISQNYPKFPLSNLFYPKINSTETISCSLNYPNTSNLNRFKGNVYLLVGPNSYSTSTDFAAIVKYYKFGTLIGEETGDAINSYGDCLNYKMPNSGLGGSVSCKYFIGESRDENKNQGVLPDYNVYSTNEAEDTVLEFTLKQISDNQSQNKN